VGLFRATAKKADASPRLGWDLRASKIAADLGTAKKVPALLGDEERLLVPALGRYGIVFGPDGSNKTTFGLNLAGGALGAPGFETLLGFPVSALPEGRGVLVLAIDGPEETAARLAGMGLADFAGGRLVVWSGPL